MTFSRKGSLPRKPEFEPVKRKGHAEPMAEVAELHLRHLIPASPSSSRTLVGLPTEASLYLQRLCSGFRLLWLAS